MATSTLWVYKAHNSSVRTDERFIVFIQGSPLKFPLMTYGMMPSGHTRSGLEVAALLRRRRLCLSALLILSLEVVLLTVRRSALTLVLLCELTRQFSIVQISKCIPALVPESVWFVLTVCCAPSLLWASLNMRRSSSSRAISPRKAAGLNR